MNSSANNELIFILNNISTIKRLL